VVRAILLFLLVLFVVRAIWRLLEGIVSGASAPSPRRRNAGAPAVKLVKDPVCGTFVVPGKSPSLVRAGETVYFCSNTCRDKYGQACP
jgi:YHS domain-containing protein